MKKGMIFVAAKVNNKFIISLLTAGQFTFTRNLVLSRKNQESYKISRQNPHR